MEMEKKDMHQHHEELVAGICGQLKAIFDNSEQGIYVYLDDVHKACNRKFAALLGYKSAEEWASLEESLLDATVEERSQNTLVSAYSGAMENLAGSTISVTWKKKGGGEVKTNVMLVPIAYQGHLFALHFVSKA